MISLMYSKTEIIRSIWEVEMTALFIVAGSNVTSHFEHTEIVRYYPYCCTWQYVRASCTLQWSKGRRSLDWTYATYSDTPEKDPLLAPE